MMYPMESSPRARQWAALTLVAVSLLGLSACGGDNGGRAEAAVTTTSTTPPATTSTTTSTTSTTTSTTLPPTTTSTTSTTTSTTSTTTSTTSTTTSTTTIPAPLPKQPTQPITPPADVHAAEPVIELGRIIIPKIGVDMALYEGIRLSTLDYGPGHWPGTAMPGELGNVVVGGHRTSKHKVFRRVDELVAGDQIIYEMPYGTFTYTVNRIEIVEPTAIWIIDPTETGTTTLFACHPPGSTRQRIVVFADLVV